MENLELLLLENDLSLATEVTRLLERSNITAVLTFAKDRQEFSNAITKFSYNVILASDNIARFSALSALKLVNDKRVTTPFIFIGGNVSEDYIVSLMKEGAADYLAKDHLERLPLAIKNALEKLTLKQDQERFFDEIVARKTLMKDAERLAHFGSWKEDLLSGSVYWSDEKYRILGYEPGEVLPTREHFLAKVHPEDREFVRATIEDAVKSKNRQKYTFRIAARNGGIKYIHSEIVVTRDSHLQVTQLNGFIRDISEHTEAEIRLVESEEKYRNLFESNPSALFVIETDTRKFLDVNKATIDLYGYSREEFLESSVYDILPEYEQKRLRESGDFFENSQSNKGLWKTIKKDRCYVQVEIITSDILFEGKKARLVIANDISGKILSINQLRESEARLMASQRIGHIGSWEVELNEYSSHNNIIRWTDETYRIFGFAPGEVELTDEFFESLVHPDDFPQMLAAMNNPIDGIFNVEFRIILRDGTERIIREMGEVVVDPETGKQIKITGTAQDITERKLAAEKLQKSEANLRSIFENTETAYVLLDMQLNIVSFNQPAFKFSVTHLNKPIVVGTYAVNYFSDSRQAMVRKSLKDALHGMNLNYEVNYHTYNGTEKWYYAHFHPVWGDAREMLGVIMSLRDITDRKTSELQEKKITSELIRRNKDLEQFAYIISHNLRAPVANIIGISEALNDENLSEEDQTIFAEGLTSSAKKLDMVITDLNRILQMKHEVNENKEKVLFSQIVSDIKFSIAGIRENDLFQLKCDFSDVDEMTTLKSYMHSIFYNLISNSLKYKKPDVTPVIEITSKKLDDKIELIFKDNGLGIDLVKDGQQLFGLYKRFHMQTAEGKGMGLFMVKTQVETLDGRITVKSKVNEGTEFKIVFGILNSAN